MAGTCQEYSFSFLPVATREMEILMKGMLVVGNVTRRSLKKKKKKKKKEKERKCSKKDNNGSRLFYNAL